MVVEGLDGRKSTVDVFLDLSKTFDSVDIRFTICSNLHTKTNTLIVVVIEEPEIDRSPGQMSERSNNNLSQCPKTKMRVS